MSNVITVTTEDVESLRERVAGTVVPGNEEWDDARQAWNLSVDQRPTAVVLPESAEDVVATVGFAAGRGLRVAPQGTGHSAEPMGLLAGTILLKTSRLRGVEIDAESRRARVGAGTLWGEGVPAAAEQAERLSR